MTKDITGERFGRLVAINETGRRVKDGSIWVFRCDCGNEVERPIRRVLVGDTKSCGCLRREVHSKIMNEQVRMLGTVATITHNMTKSKTWTAWINMKQRCYNSKHKSFITYGGRGITVCDRWLESFENFLADMGEAPVGTSLDRIDVDGNYEPGNCRWATFIEQGNNRRTNVFLEFNGKTQTIAEWAREVGMGPKTLAYRIKNDWPIETALTMGADRANRISGVILS